MYQVQPRVNYKDYTAVEFAVMLHNTCCVYIGDADSVLLSADEVRPAQGDAGI